MPLGWEGEYLAMGRTWLENVSLVRCPLWWFSLSWCVWLREGNLGPGRVGEHFSWEGFVGRVSDSFP